MLSIRFAVSAVLASSVAATASADVPTSATALSTTLSEVVVTATRTPTPIEAVLASVTVINHEELVRTSVIDVSDALRFLPGIDVARTGGIGQTTSIFIRGAESNHTLVLIDGVRVNPGTIGVAAIQNIPPELVERMEIVKGPRSTLYGSDAIGGVINIITRAAPKDGLLGEAQWGWGTFNTEKASGLLEMGNDKISGGVSAAYITSDGFPAKQNSTVDSPYDNLSIGANLRTNIGPISASLRHLQAEGTAAYLSFFGAPLDQDFKDSVTALVLEAKPVAAWTTTLTSSHMEDHIEQNQPVNAAVHDFLDTKRDLFDWQNEIRVGDANRLVAGAMYSLENASTKAFSSFDTDTDVLNLYAQDQFTSGRHMAQLAVGFTDHETAGQHTTWNAEYGFSPSDNGQIILSAGTAFRAPDATDRYGFGGNPNLEPEESQNLELSLRHSITTHQSLQLSVYQNDINNLITYDNAVGKLRNIDEARIRGVEAGYVIKGESWKVNAAANFQNPIDRSTGKLLLRRSQQSFSLGYDQTFGRVGIGANASYTGPRDDFGFPNNVVLDAYTLVNLHASFAMTDNFTLLANVENVFDEQYELADGYNTADCSVFVSLKYSTH
jgi:vitamin B12 transporter